MLTKVPNKFSKTLKVIAGHLARNCGGRPLQWLDLPIEQFFREWECVSLSFEAENEATKEEIAKQKSNSKSPECDFDEWMSETNRENAVTNKEKKYGIKRKK